MRIKEDGEWQLEAGALVLSDGGVCCIDEISQLREHDRTAIHEAMEQQTISIAKAGIVCKLNTRCAVIAACNPKGHYQTDEPLSANVSLGTPLLSRFDLIFILLDSKNHSWDKLVSSHILFGASDTKTSKTRWSMEKLQMYIGLVGPRNTEMTKSANTILQAYYMMQRKSYNRDPSRTTVRMLDSLVRLSQAHCRLMYRNTILPVDAITAVSLVDLSMQDYTSNDTVDALHSTFQKYPDYEYLCNTKKLLTRLNLQHIWKEELLYYAKLLKVDHKTLECDLEKGNILLFSKYDEVTDENIPLSASLVTSSYFHKNSTKTGGNKETMNKENLSDDVNIDQKAVVNDRLAATLKKHAALNKCENKPINMQKKKVNRKRKRKELTVDTSSLRKKVGKKQKDHLNVDLNNITDSDEDTYDATKMLNAVPSVNDVFNDLHVDLKIESDKFNESSSKTKQESKCITVSKDVKDSNEDNIDKLRGNTEVVSKTKTFLKQFEFVNKHKTEYKDTASVEKLNGIKKEPNESVNKKTISASSSQISIFESTDCDIDLDI